jgi:transcription antitermination factor NusG
MPILPCEPNLYPADLLDDHLAANGDTSWWALYTMSRREKDLMRRLHAVEIPFYAPLIPQRKRSPAGRLRTTYAPLFPGYVFLRGSDDERRAALETNCVSRCLSVSDGARLVSDLKQIHRLIESDAPLTPEARLEPGHRVRVCSGVLIGLEGTVVKRHGQNRLLVAVGFLQQGASVQFDDCAVERID